MRNQDAFYRSRETIGASTIDMTHAMLRAPEVGSSVVGDMEGEAIGVKRPTGAVTGASVEGGRLG